MCHSRKSNSCNPGGYTFSPPVSIHLRELGVRGPSVRFNDCRRMIRVGSLPREMARISNRLAEGKKTESGLASRMARFRQEASEAGSR